MSFRPGGLSHSNSVTEVFAESRDADTKEAFAEDVRSVGIVLWALGMLTVPLSVDVQPGKGWADYDNAVYCREAGPLMAAVVSDCLAADAEVPDVPFSLPKNVQRRHLKRRLKEKGHLVVPRGSSGGLSCQRCHCYVTAPLRRHWIDDGDWRGSTPTGEAPQGMKVRFGRHVLHASHVLCWNADARGREGWQCRHCGAAARIRARQLLAPSRKQAAFSTGAGMAEHAQGSRDPVPNTSTSNSGRRVGSAAGPHQGSPSDPQPRTSSGAPPDSQLRVSSAPVCCAPLTALRQRVLARLNLQRTSSERAPNGT